MKKLFSIFTLLVIVALAIPGAANAQQADVIRGRITGPDSAAIQGVVVTATSIGGNVSRTARTDASGRFTITFPNGEGDYMISLAAIGYAAKRFEIKRTADEEILIADSRLNRIGTILEDMRVTAERPKMSRTEANQPDVSGTERQISNGAVATDLLGDLAAMAASLPGVQAVQGDDGSNGYSVLGLGADQNNTTLNGMNFGGSSIPRDAAVRSSLITSPYDVSRGGFSGGQFSINTRPGSNFMTRGMSLNIDAPQLQWTDRASRALGQEYTNLSLGGAMSGPIKFDKSFYNISYQLGRRSNEMHTLLSTNANGLEAAGVAPDSVSRLLGLLQTRGIPLTTRAVPSSRIGDQGSLFGSIDIAPPSSNSGQAVNISFNGNWNRQAPVSAFATELPSHSGEQTSWRGGLQGKHSSYVKNKILSETSGGVSLSRTFANPFLDLPNAFVRVNSQLSDGTSSVQALQFGGNSNLNSDQTQTSASILNQLSWFSVNNKHRVKLASELRRDGSKQEQSNNTLGTFTFNSLSDFETGRTSAFTRQLGVRERDISQYVAGFSLGDAYRRSTDLQIQYGVRVDANRFGNTPNQNPQIESLFGVRNDEVPNRVYLSPRIGFSWTYGTAAQIGGFEGAFRGPRAVLRGGAGVFQNNANTGLTGSAVDNTGLPSAVQQLACFGGAAPVPDWNSYAASTGSIPVKCADGSTGSVFSNVAPNVSLFAPDYNLPRSVRSNLQWSGPILGNRFSSTIEATYSLNLDQAGNIDLNFNGTPRFALASEAGRPVYVRQSSIVPPTGAVSPTDSRKSALFSRVTEFASDLRSESKQLSFRLSPVSFNSNFSWGASYVYSNVREQVRGFSNTAGNPLDKEWARAQRDSRHNIVYNLGYNFFDWARVNWFGNFRSGSPYTPMVSGDVNGDGYSNDRAYIPGATSANAASLENLLRTGSSSANDCLSKQVGKLAARNSCQGPWYTSANMSFSLNPVKMHMPQRATVSFSVSNPLGAADLLLHGSDDLRGWGQPSFPDASLLYVRGFDPVAQAYKYEVNQGFGKTNKALSGFRSPVTLTATMRFDVGPTRERQMLTQQLDRGRTTAGTKQPEGSLRLLVMNGSTPNPMAPILRQQDSLKLTSVQADSIAVINRSYTIKADQIWAPIVKEFAALPNNYDRSAVYDRYIKARKQTIDLMISIAPAVKGLLTDAQWRKLPAFVASNLDTRYLASIRNGTAMFTGSSGFGGGGFEGMFVRMDTMVGGGGGGVTIIRQ
ncbi:MAG: carboxypeptidase regulatory-like domain-containing protein [Gemmatimonadaceae bacterium]|nr:carboxypeptidase regulatory-like domain-containing protein [Gemmatimonadaceae bacterium]